MRREICTFVLLLLGAMICVSVIPQTDLPETSYNEVDTPVNQAPPVIRGVRLVRPSITPVILSKQVCEALRDLTAQGHERKSPGIAVRRDPHSLQDLLCTLLI